MKHAQIKRIAMMLCLSGATLTSYADPDPNFHIYICWGQSNMEGNATVPNEEKQNVPERFQMLYTADDCSNGDRKKGQWYTAIPPLARCFHGSNKGYGPVDNFGRTLVAELDPEIRVGVVVVACGGTSIGLFERDYCEEFLRTAADWLQGYAREYGGNPYKRMIEMGKLAQESGVIKGILVHQGENDSGQESWPNRLKGVYETILEDLNLNASEVPLLVGEVRHDGQCSEHNKIIQKVPSVIPTAHVISSEGCEAERDIYHFSVKGYKELGKRYAEKMIELLGDNPVQLQDISLSAFTAKDNEPGEIAITINVENSEIQKVELYADNELLTDEITASASYTWENVSGGEHSIWAVGYDNSGKEYKTSTKKITIKDSVRDTYFTAVMHVYKNETTALKAQYDAGTLTAEAYNDALSEIFNRHDAETLKKVETALNQLTDNVILEVDEGKSDMVLGKIYANLAWSGDSVFSMDEAEEKKVELAYEVPEEGSNVWFDGWCMPKGANKEASLMFLDFLADPEIAVMNMDAVGYTSPIAGQAIWDNLCDWYEADDDVAEEDCEEVDLSYFFEGTLDAGKEAKVMIAKEDRGRQFDAQYPTEEVITRCAIMRDFGKEGNDALYKMWNKFTASF